MAAEAEAVGHHAIDDGFAGDVGDIIEIAKFVGIIEVDRRRQDIGMNRQRRGDQLDAAGSAEQVAELALGARNLELLGVPAEDRFHRLGFGEIAQLGAGSVRVDVADRVGIATAVDQAHAHGSRRASAFLVGSGDVGAVGGHAVAENLGVNTSAASERDVFLFENQDAGSFGQDEAVAFFIERPAGALGFVVAGREARSAAKPPSPIGVIAASEPPVTMMSASPA